MHALLEYLPLIIFFVVYKFVDIYWATAAIIICMVLQTLFYIVKKKDIPTRHWVIFGLVTVFGGLTIILQNDTFIKWKVTVIYTLFSIGLIVSERFFNKNVIKEFLSEALELPEKIWQNLNISWAIFFAALAIANTYVAHYMSQETWVNFKVFGLLGATLVFAFVSIMFLVKYIPDEEESNVEEQQEK